MRTFVFFLCAMRAIEVLSPEITGIGVVFGMEEDEIVIRGIVPGSAASFNKAVHLGDRILAVAQDKESPVKVKGMSVSQVVSLIRGPKGKAIRLTIVPAGKTESQAREVSVVRGSLDVGTRQKLLFEDGILPATGSKA